MKGFVFTVEGTKYASMASYVSEWNPLDIGEDINKYGETGIQLAIELPVSAGNEFQEKSASIKLTVEAVQNNADISATDDVTVRYITTANDAATLAAKLESDEVLHVFLDGDIVETCTIDQSIGDKILDANGHNVKLQIGTGADNDIDVTSLLIKNINNIDNPVRDKNEINIMSGVSGNITIADSKFLGSNVKRFINGSGDAEDRLDVLVEKCEFEALTDNSGKIKTDSAIYFYHTNNITVRDCKFVNLKSWTIIVNGPVYGNLTVSNCTFDKCTGIVKAAVSDTISEALEGNFTFANNVLTECYTKDMDLKYDDGTTVKDENKKTVKIGVYMDISPINGLIIFSNNTLDDVIITPEDMVALGKIPTIPKPTVNP